MSSSLRFRTLAATLLIAGGVVAGLAARQTPGRGASESALIQQVRVALGHGQVDEARRLAGTPPTAAGRDLANALVDIFEGKDAEARAKLEPLAKVSAAGDAALELGLIEIRTGQRDQGMRRLDVIAGVRTFAGPDDYYRLARAAVGIREFLLANDAYVQIQNIPRADIQSEWGTVFYTRHKPGDAVTNFTRALEIDPAWIPALLGLARALHGENPKAADSAMEQARKLAPNHPDLWLLNAEWQIGRQDYTGAAESLDRLAKVRPNTVHEAALRGAVAFARNDRAGVEAAIARVKTIDARSALAYIRLFEQSARDLRFDEAAAFAKTGASVDPDDPYIHFDLGMAYMRTGDEAAARVALERSWDLDKSSPFTKNLLDVLDRIDKMETVTSGNVTFKFAREQANVLKTYAIPLVEEAMKTFSARYGFTPPTPILIEIFPSHDDFAVRTMGLPGLVGALGACFGQVIAMDSPTALQPGRFSWQATLWHEVAHVFTLQLSKYRVPRWLTEGISVFEEHRRMPAWGRELTPEFAAEYGRGRMFGVKGLPAAFKRPESIALAYFEASLLVEHLVELNGDAALRTLLLAYAEGATDTDAFARAFAKGVDEVDASFRKFVESRYAALGRALADPPTKVAPTDLPGLRDRASASPGNYFSQMTYGTAALKAGQREEAKRVLEVAARLVPQPGTFGSPRALLAELAEQAGNREAARNEWRELLVWDHENVEAARRLAAAAGTSPDAADDREYALRVIADLDPFDGDAHRELGRRLLAKGQFPAAAIEFRAALALGPANLAEAQTDFAEALFKMGRKEEAKRQLLLALQQAPSYARAQDLLLSVIGR